MKEGCGSKDYMNEKKTEEVRLMFKKIIRVGLLPFAGNFSNDKKDLQKQTGCAGVDWRKTNHI